MWAARSWNRIWKKQGLPAAGYSILEQKFEEQISIFDQAQKRIFKDGAGAPEGFDADAKVQRVRDAVQAIFSAGASEQTLKDAYTLVQDLWREFSSAFVASNISSGSSSEFDEDYKVAMDSFKSYATVDSVRGLITFCQNRIVWAGAEAESRITDDLKAYGTGELEFFNNQF